MGFERKSVAFRRLFGGRQSAAQLRLKAHFLVGQIQHFAPVFANCPGSRASADGSCTVHFTVERGAASIDFAGCVATGIPWCEGVLRPNRQPKESWFCLPNAGPPVWRESSPVAVKLQLFGGNSSRLVEPHQEGPRCLRPSCSLFSHSGVLCVKRQTTNTESVQ